MATTMQCPFTGGHVEVDDEDSIERYKADGWTVAGEADDEAEDEAKPKRATRSRKTS